MSEQLSLLEEKEKTLQDFRNELQEIHYKETHRMQQTGDTGGSNMLHRILRKLDIQYGTEFQKTASVIKAEEGAGDAEE